MAKEKNVDQLTIAKIIATKLSMTPSDVMSVIEMEQKTTMSYVKRGYRVVKKNYLTIFPKMQKGREIKSPLNGQVYQIADSIVVRVRVGEGFKSYVSNRGTTMPNKICRFVKETKTDENLAILPQKVDVEGIKNGSKTT